MQDQTPEPRGDATTEKVILPVEEVKSMEEGKRYRGTIMNVKERKEPYRYVDLLIHVEDLDMELRYGVPAKVSEATKLGKLLSKFTTLPIIGSNININETLISKRVSFMITHEKKDGKEYIKIIDDTLIPVQ